MKKRAHPINLFVLRPLSLTPADAFFSCYRFFEFHFCASCSIAKIEFWTSNWTKMIHVYRNILTNKSWLAPFFIPFFTPLISAPFIFVNPSYSRSCERFKGGSRVFHLHRHIFHCHKIFARHFVASEGGGLSATHFLRR